MVPGLTAFSAGRAGTRGRGRRRPRGRGCPRRAAGPLGPRRGRRAAPRPRSRGRPRTGRRCPSREQQGWHGDPRRPPGVEGRLWDGPELADDGGAAATRAGHAGCARRAVISASGISTTSRNIVSTTASRFPLASSASSRPPTSGGVRVRGRRRPAGCRREHRGAGGVLAGQDPGAQPQTDRPNASATGSSSRSAVRSSRMYSAWRATAGSSRTRPPGVGLGRDPGRAHPDPAILDPLHRWLIDNVQGA
jgi:hypothetical protein